MDFSWSDKQLAFKNRVIQFAQENLNGDMVERDYHGKFSWDNWEKCAEFGIQGMCMPEEYSDSPPLDIMTAVLAMEALGYGCEDNGLTLGLNAQMWTVQILLLQFGTEEQKQRYLPLVFLQVRSRTKWGYAPCPLGKSFLKIVLYLKRIGWGQKGQGLVFPIIL